MTELKPRTKLEALKHMLSEYKANRLGAYDPNASSCVYEVDGHNGKIHCIVGCLFTPEQHQWIREHDLQDARIHALALYVGNKNIEFMSGMTIEELTRLQVLHDDASKAARNQYAHWRKTWGNLGRILEQKIAEEMAATV